MNRRYTVMDRSILASRLDLLRKTQNTDGGWGYIAGKQSWLEPTFYAALALGASRESERAWTLVRSWQQDDGGWVPNGSVPGATWVTALGVLMSCIQGDTGVTLQRGVRWLLTTTGVENSFLNRLIYRITGNSTGRDTSNRGWPWRPDTAAWVEPTALSMVALRHAFEHFHHSEVTRRIREGENLLLSMRSRDGGWNYGSREALGVPLPSYAETTALAALALQKRTPPDVQLSAARSQSRLADAWSALACQCLGRPAMFAPPVEAPADLMIAALEALAIPGGNGSALWAKPESRS